MKNTGKILAFVLCLIMIFTTAVVEKTTAVFADSTVTKIHFTMRDPVEKQKISVSKPAKSTADGASSNYSFEYKWKTSDSKFSSSEIQLQLTIKPSKGYTLAYEDPDFEISINDTVFISQTASVGTVKSASESEIVIECPFTPHIDADTLTVVYAKGLVPPTVGKKITTTGLRLTSTKQQTINTAKWLVSDTGKSGSYVDVPAGASFEAGKYYAIDIALTLAEGVSFYKNTKTETRINDLDAQLLWNDETSDVHIYHEYPVLSKVFEGITSIDLDSVIAPVAGEHPNNKYIITERPTGCISVVKNYGYWYVYDSEKGYIPFTGATFEVGKSYAFMVHFKTEDDYIIDSNTKIRAMDEDTALDADEKGNWFIGIYYPKLKKNEPVNPEPVVDPDPGKTEDPEKTDDPVTPGENTDPQDNPDDPGNENNDDKNHENTNAANHTITTIAIGAAGIILVVLGVLLSENKKKK